MLGIELAVILLLILLSGLFSMVEMALASARKARLQQRVEEGSSNAAAALKLLDSYDHLFPAIRSGISLLGMLTGVFSGAALLNEVSLLLSPLPLSPDSRRILALLVLVLVLTYFSVVLGELIPKRLALSSPETISLAAARPVRGFVRLITPFVHLLNASAEAGLRLLGAGQPQEDLATEEEIITLIEQGTQQGEFDEAQQDMVASVFRMGERTVDAIMTPRTEINWLDLEEPFQNNLKKILNNPHTCFPAALSNLDHVQGVILAKDMLAATLKSKTPDLKKLIKPVIFFPESTPALKALEQVKLSGMHMSMVIDEYGGLLGVVTPYDFLKSLVGDLPAAGEKSTPQACQRPDGSWLMDGLLRVDELKELLNLDSLPEEERIGYQTLGGLVMSRMGVIPSAGQFFDHAGLRFEVLDMDGKRVDKVLVFVPPSPAPSEPSKHTGAV
jgi:putative hemolysin